MFHAESTFTEGLKLLKPDDACLSYSCLTRLIELGTETFDEVRSKEYIPRKYCSVLLLLIYELFIL